MSRIIKSSNQSSLGNALCLWTGPGLWLLFGGSQAVPSSCAKQPVGENIERMLCSLSNQQDCGSNWWGRTCDVLCSCSPETMVLSWSTLPFVSFRQSVLIPQQKAHCSLDNALCFVTGVVFTLSDSLCLVQTLSACQGRSCGSSHEGMADPDLGVKCWLGPHHNPLTSCTWHPRGYC